jgi:hypothetical protein
MGHTKKIILAQSDNNFLLFIHYKFKDRAKSISGYKWDSSRKCWLFPKNKNTYDAIIGEFGSELIMEGISRSEILSKSPTISEMVVQNENLKNELGKIQKSLELISKTGNKNNNELEKKLAENENLILEKTKHISSLENKVFNLDNELTETRNRLNASQERNKVELGFDEFEKQVFDLAVDATGGDKKFINLIDNLKLNNELPNKITKSLSNELFKMLDINPFDRDYNLARLLEEARDSQDLENDAFYLSQTIRRQRNIVIHESVHEKTYQARNLLCIFAAALVWPELPE